MRPVLVLTATAVCALAGAAAAQAPQRYLTWPGKDQPAPQAASPQFTPPMASVGPEASPTPHPVADRYGPAMRPTGLSRPLAGGDSRPQADRGGRVQPPASAPTIYDDAPEAEPQRLADTRPPLVGFADLSPPASGRESPEAAGERLPPLQGEEQTGEPGEGGEPTRQLPAQQTSTLDSRPSTLSAPSTLPAPAAQQVAAPAAAPQPWSAGRGEGQGVPSRRYSVQREVGQPALDPAFFAAGQATDLAEPPPVVDPWYGQGRQPDPVARPTDARAR